MITVFKKIKENIFFVFIVVGYIVIIITRPQLSMQAIKNSDYYIKEMLLILPVIFILTALLDTWMPKQTIIKYLGKESKFKGTVLSFALGSVSAEPIYAAFPICKMLHIFLTISNINHLFKINILIP